jgi:hypothetical protein
MSSVTQGGLGRKMHGVCPTSFDVASESEERTRPRVLIAALRRNALGREKFAMARAPSVRAGLAVAREARALPRGDGGVLVILGRDRTIQLVMTLNSYFPFGKPFPTFATTYSYLCCPSA